MSRILIALLLLAQMAQPTEKLNHLGNAKTRYLARNAASPVDWHPWSAATIAKAKKAGKPIFLTIGYASCHWCHVMERESFRNAELAEMLNAYFVPVLVDREEYPELDATYLAFLEQPSWPASFVLDHEQQPLVTIPYMKPDALSRRLVIISNQWASERASMQRLSPKPRARTAAAELTPEALRALAASPRHDQIGGGFHRAAGSFEKMLHDQALLAMAYTEAWRRTRDEDFASVARGTLDYVLRDLKQLTNAAFHSSQDSDSLVPGMGPELVEGAFYRWRHDELTPLLGEDDAKLVARYYGIKEATPHNLPHVADAPLAREHPETLAKARARLQEVRSKRPAPFRDDKVLTGWNGLMISALARAGVVLDEPRYLDAASAAARFVTAKLWNPTTKTLRRRWANDEAAVDALPEDYAMLAQGLLDLFESTGDVRWLDLAVTLQTRQDELFRERAPVELLDAVPSAETVAASNRARFEAMYGQQPGRHIVIVGNPRTEAGRKLLVVAHRSAQPRTIALAMGGALQLRLAAYMPHVKAMAPVDKQPAAYVCDGGVCQPPITDPLQLERVLGVRRP